MFLSILDSEWEWKAASDLGTKWVDDNEQVPISIDEYGHQKQVHANGMG